MGGAGWRWYAERLRAMSPQEVAWRAASAATLPLREQRSAGRPRWDPRLADALPRDEAAAARIAGGELQLWGRRVEVDLARTPWHADPLDGTPLPARSWRTWGRDPKPVWELHRQQHLVPLALAGDDDARRLGREHVLDWIGRNPRGTPYGWSSAYEVAERVVTWTFAVPSLGFDALQQEVVDTSYAQQIAYVAARPSRFSSANNHRLAELTALLAAAHVGIGAWTPRWRELERQVAAQTYADGGSREQAAGYFLYAVEIIWVAALLARARGRELGLVGERLQAMLEWLAAVADEDGEPPSFGDDAEDRMLRVDYFEPRRARRIAELAGADKPRATTSLLLPESGYALFRGEGLYAAFDVGELGLGSLAAHGHADALALVVRGCVRDSGTGSYFPADGRDPFRVTSAHNTVTVDGRSQAEPLGPHMWGRRYRVAIEGAGFGAVDYVRALHDGYAPATHTRSVTRVGGLLVVLDRIRAPQPVTATLAWHPEEGAQIKVRAVPDADAAQVEAPWSPRYRDLRTGTRLTWTSRGTDVVFATVLGDAAAPELEHEAGVTTLRLPQVRLTERWVGPMIETGG